MDFYKLGQHEALAQLGFYKEAAPPLLGRIGGWLAKKVPTRAGIKRFMIGDPRAFGKELLQGKALSKGSLIRQSLAAPDFLTKALFYGLPAYQAINIATDPMGNKAQRMGGLLGGNLLGLAAWRPFGILGSMAAGSLGEQLGSAVGQTGQFLATGKRPSTSGYLPEY